MKTKFFTFSTAGILAILLAALLIFTGCPASPGFDQPAITSVTVEVTEVVTATPANGVTTPAPGQPTPNQQQQEQVTGVNIRMAIQAVNFDLVSEVGQTDGDGYIVYYLDQIPEVIQREAVGAIIGDQQQNQQNQQQQQPQIQLQQNGRTITSTATEFVWENVQPGLRFFSAQLVDAQGNSISPPAVVVVAAFIPHADQQPAQQQQQTPAQTPAQ